jgi:hypothetical protein
MGPLDPDYYGKRLADYPAGYRMELVCTRCRHSRSFTFAGLLARLGPDATVGDVARRGRCTHVRHDFHGRALPPCGGRASALPGPEPARVAPDLTKLWRPPPRLGGDG